MRLCFAYVCRKEMQEAPRSPPPAEALPRASRSGVKAKGLRSADATPPSRADSDQEVPSLLSSSAPHAPRNMSSAMMGASYGRVDSQPGVTAVVRAAEHAQLPPQRTTSLGEMVMSVSHSTPLAEALLTLASSSQAPEPNSEHGTPRGSEGTFTPLGTRKSSPRLLQRMPSAGIAGGSFASNPGGGGGPAEHHPLWSLPSALLKQSSMRRESSTTSTDRPHPSPVHRASPVMEEQHMRRSSPDLRASGEPNDPSLASARVSPTVPVLVSGDSKGRTPSPDPPCEGDAQPPGGALSLHIPAANNSADDVHLGSGFVVDAPFVEVTFEIPDARLGSSSEACSPSHSPPIRKGCIELSATDAAASTQCLFCHVCGASADSARELKFHWMLCDERCDALLETLVAHPLCSVLAYPTHPMRAAVTLDEVQTDKECRDFNRISVDILFDKVCLCRGCGTGHTLREILHHIQYSCPRHMKTSQECTLTVAHNLTPGEREEVAVREHAWKLGQITEETHKRLLLGAFPWGERQRSTPGGTVRPRGNSSAAAQSAARGDSTGRTPRRSRSPQGWRR